MKIGLEAVGSVARRAYLAMLMLSVACFALAFPAWGQGGETGGIGGSGVSSETGGIGGTGIHSEGGGIGGTGHPIVGYGPIQAFGSVFVNGREYEIGRTTRVTVNGEPASPADLHVGDLAKVQGVATTAGHGIAQQIAINFPIAGPIAAIANKDNAFVVVGQRIIPANPAMMAQLKVGQAVAVSAQQRSDGTWVAYRVASYSRPKHFRIEGRVTATGNRVIQINHVNLTIQRPLPAAVRPGERVIVTGEVNAQGFEATHVASAPLVLGTPGTRVEIHDYFHSAGQGRLIAADGLTAQGAPGTVHVHGAEPVQISGYLSGRGAVQVEHLEIVAPIAALPSQSSLKPKRPVARGGKKPALGEESAHEPSDQRTEKSEASAPRAEPPEGQGHEIESPGTAGPEVEPPEVEPPEVEPPEVEPPEVEPPEVEPPDN